MKKKLDSTEFNVLPSKRKLKQKVHSKLIKITNLLFNEKGFNNIY